MNEKPTARERHDLRNIIAIPILVLVGLIAVVGGLGIINHFSQQSKMNQYLDEKYGQEFVVENVGLRGGGLGVQGAWTGEAYPKSDPSLRFRIDKSQTTGKVSVDTFLQTLWTRQGTGEVATFLAKELPNNERYFLTITPGNNPGNALYDSIQGKTPSLSDVLKDHNNGIVYNLTVNDITHTVSGEPSDASLENAMKIVNFVKAKGVDIPSVNYGYRDISFTERTNSGQQKYQYRIKLEREALQAINTSSDLRQYFEVIKY